MLRHMGLGSPQGKGKETPTVTMMALMLAHARARGRGMQRTHGLGLAWPSWSHAAEGQSAMPALAFLIDACRLRDVFSRNQSSPVHYSLLLPNPV